MQRQGKQMLSRTTMLVFALVAFCAPGFLRSVTGQIALSALDFDLPPAPAKHVLIVHSYSARVQYTRQQDSAIRETLAQSNLGTLSIQAVELDIEQNNLPEEVELLRDYLSRRFRGDQFDLLIATDTPATEFMLKYSAQLFPGVPVVFSASKRIPTDEERTRLNITGVAESVDARRTIELIRRLHPEMKQLWLILDTSGHARDLRDLARAALDEMPDPPEEVWLDSLPYETLRQQLMAAPDDAVILFLAYRDASYRRTTLQDMLRPLAESASRPMYALYDTYLGHGVVGGVMASAKVYGELSGALGARVLRGEDAATIPVLHGELNPAIFDHQVLRRWGMRENLLPTGSVILNRHESFFDKYGKVLVWSGAIAIVQGLIIGGLIVSRVRWRRAEAALRANEEILRSTAENMPGVVYTSVRTPDGRRWFEYASPGLERLIGEEAAHRARVDIEQYFALIAPEHQTVIQDTAARALRDGKPFDCEYQLVLASGEKRWVRSTAAVQRLGDGSRRWHGVLMDITEQRETEAALRESRERLRAIMSNIPGIVYRTELRPDGMTRLVYTSAGYEQLFGTAPSYEWRPLREYSGRYLDEDERDLIALTLRSAETLEPLDTESRIIDPQGGIRWIHKRSIPSRTPEGSVVWDGVCMDITLKRQAEFERRQFFELSGDLLCIAGMDGRLRLVSPSWTRTLGWSREELVSRPWLDFVHPDDRDATVAAASVLQSKRRIVSFENRYITKSGDYRWLSWNATYEPDSNLIFAVTRDMTESRRSSEALRESEERYRSLFNASPQPMMVYDTRTLAFLAVNNAAIEAYGYSREEWLSMTFRDVLPENEVERLEGYIARGIEKHASPSLWKHRLKSGVVIDVEVNAEPVQFIAPTARLVLVRDITMRVRAERAVRESEERLRQISENAREILWLYDASSQQMVYISPACAQVWGRSVEELMRSPELFLECIHPEDLDEYKSKTRSIQSGYDVEFRVVHPQHGQRWVRDRAYPVHDEDGRVVRVAGVTEDITQAKLTEESLRRTAHLQQLLLSELDHRVKNSFAGLLTLIDLTRSEQTSVESFADSIRARVAAMVSVHTLLSESHWAPIGLQRLLLGMMPPGTPGQLEMKGDPVEVPAHQASALAMILQELATNSVKYGAGGCPNGRIMVQWSLETRPEAGTVLWLNWEETGGPPVQTPVKSRLGTRLIEGFTKFELGGSVELGFLPQGVRHRFLFVLDYENQINTVLEALGEGRMRPPPLGTNSRGREAPIGSAAASRQIDHVNGA